MLCLAINTAYATQVCHSNVINEWPDSRYIDHNDGTLTDTVTGLMWMQCSEGQTSANNTCTGKASTYTWQEAAALAKSKTFAGYSNWRLPHIRELYSLANSNCFDPSINQTIFPNSSSYQYWSSSLNVNDTSRSGSAWTVFFYGGITHISNRNGSHRVRLVRSRQ